METTRNRLPPNVIAFFDTLSTYLDTKLLYFGSVQRDDYFPGASDIDVDVFADNEDSIMRKMESFLHIDKHAFKSIVWRLTNKRVVYGHKCMYKSPDGSFSAEFSIYNEKYKDDIIFEHTRKFVLPFYITWFLVILKLFYYNWGIIPKEVYTYLKKKCLTLGIGLPDDEFIVLESK